MDISKITDVLFVGTQPQGSDYEILHELGIELIINMRAEQAPYPDPLDPPIRTIWLQTHDNALMPIPRSALLEGVEAALPLVQEGRRVLAHCRAGRHRSVAMAAAILIALGHSAEEAMAMLKAKRPEADPDEWHIKRRIEKFEAYWIKIYNSPNGKYIFIQ